MPKIIHAADFHLDSAFGGLPVEKARERRRESRDLLRRLADLARQVQPFCQVDFMAVSSYGSGTSSSGQVNIVKDLTESIEGKDVIVVEDILDSGNTLSYLFQLLKARNPASLKRCTLLDKPSRRSKPIAADYVGFTVPDEFVVGYGLDYGELYRNLPYIGVLKPQVYEK